LKSIQDFQLVINSHAPTPSPPLSFPPGFLDLLPRFAGKGMYTYSHPPPARGVSRNLQLPAVSNKNQIRPKAPKGKVINSSPGQISLLVGYEEGSFIQIPLLLFGPLRLITLRFFPLATLVVRLISLSAPSSGI